MFAASGWPCDADHAALVVEAVVEVRLDELRELVARSSPSRSPLPQPARNRALPDRVQRVDRLVDPGPRAAAARSRGARRPSCRSRAPGTPWLAAQREQRARRPRSPRSRGPVDSPKSERVGPQRVGELDARADPRGSREAALRERHGEAAVGDVVRASRSRPPRRPRRAARCRRCSCSRSTAGGTPRSSPRRTREPLAAAELLAALAEQHDRRGPARAKCATAWRSPRRRAAPTTAIVGVG